MQHRIKIASALEVVPVMSAAAAMAYSTATLCDSPFHKPTYIGNLDGLLERLLADVGSEVLPARDQYGRPGTQDEVIHRAKERGTYSEVLTADGSIDLAVTLGLCIYVSIPDLNRWGGATGDSFAIDSSGAEWVDERGVMKAGRQLVEGGAVAKVPAPPAGVELEQKPRAIARSETQAGRLDEWLSECERRAKEKGLPFDREYMPGSKKDLLKLLHALDPELRSIKMVGSLDNHLDRLERRCRWSLKASAMESAMGLYQELFPEAMLRARGNSAST